MKIGFCLPHETDAMGGDTASGAQIMQFARRAEEVGFDSVWLVDHFCYSAAGELEALGASAPPELVGRTYRGMGVHGHRRWRWPARRAGSRSARWW